jgi:hypothetical protein
MKIIIALGIIGMTIIGCYNPPAAPYSIAVSYRKCDDKKHCHVITETESDITD